MTIAMIVLCSCVQIKRIMWNIAKQCEIKVIFFNEGKKKESLHFQCRMGDCLSFLGNVTTLDSLFISICKANLKSSDQEACMFYEDCIQQIWSSAG